MATIDIENTEPTVGTKIHMYVREATTPLADFAAATVSSALAASSHFKKVESGFTLEESEGDSINTTTGQKIVLSKNIAGEFLALGLTSVDYNALMDSSTGYNLKDLDILLLQAPANQADDTAIAGNNIYATYKVNVNIRLIVADGQATKVSLSFERIDESTTKSITFDKVVA